MPQQRTSLMAELEQLGRHPDRLEVAAPALRAILQGLARDRRAAARSGNLVAAEQLRRCQERARDVLQAIEDPAL